MAASRRQQVGTRSRYRRREASKAAHRLQLAAAPLLQPQDRSAADAGAAMGVLKRAMHVLVATQGCALRCVRVRAVFRGRPVQSMKCGQTYVGALVEAFQGPPTCPSPCNRAARTRWHAIARKKGGMNVKTSRPDAPPHAGAPAALLVLRC
jgi:hypothetical protein